MRGINAKEKWSSIREKIVDSECDIVCFQETKKEVLDHSFMRNFCPADFDKFAFLPSVGA